MSTSAALTIVGSQSIETAPSDFGEEHKRIVRDAYAPTATPAEFEVLWLGAKSRGLDPVKKQIHFVKRYDNARECDVWSSQTSIDGFRAIADSTRLYDGQDEPEYEYDAKGLIILARVKAYRKDHGRPSVGVARWSEFAQFKRNGDPLYMWKKMPFHMLGKCAEAVALRKAFPEKLSGLYIHEEMPQEEVDPLPPRTVDLRVREVTEPMATTPPALPVSTPAHVGINGDAAFSHAPPTALVGLLNAARGTGDGAAAEIAFAARVAFFFGECDAEGWDELKAICTAASLPEGDARRTVGRAMKASDARLGTR